jgi:hypothetical protein
MLGHENKKSFQSDNKSSAKTVITYKNITEVKSTTEVGREMRTHAKTWRHATEDVRFMPTYEIYDHADELNERWLAKVNPCMSYVWVTCAVDAFTPFHGTRFVRRWHSHVLVSWRR